ncbi:MAG: BMP family ABC transporter substrate-binding protein, partial [Oscillospiraceae bacterium]|jgi:basic membrane protein A|nr:BMP family ABC transporter substrate-binding protein [Oscillospiraceae bacterium]
VFGLPYKVPFETLLQNIKQFQGQLMVAAGKVERRVEDVESGSGEEIHRPFFGFGKQKAKIAIAVAYDGTPETNLWTDQHNRAITRLERKYGERLSVKRLTNVPGVGELAYRTLSAAAEEKPALLFTASPNLSTISLRYALEHPETVVLNCDVPHQGKNLHTYFCKMYDLTFLCGVLAAAMSESGVIGYMSSAKTWDTKTTYDLNAFALGARIINPRAVILDYAMSGVNNWGEHDLARAEFGANGADVAFCRHSPDNPLDRKAFPEVYAQLYMIAPNGAPLESIAAATMDWEPFYDRMISDALLGRTALTGGGKDNSPVHFGWGFQTGIMDIFPVYSVVGVAGRLLRVFRDLLKSGGLHPFEGPVFDNEGNLRIGADDIPTLMEIQEMSWYAYSVRGLNY